MKRRQFLAAAVAAPAATLAASATKAVAQPAAARPAVPAKPQTVGDTQAPSEQRIVTSGKVGGDFMVDCLRALNIDYVASCPAQRSAACRNPSSITA